MKQKDAIEYLRPELQKQVGKMAKQIGRMRKVLEADVLLIKWFQLE